MTNIIAFCLAICLLMLISYFLLKGKFGGWIFFLCLVAILFFLIVFIHFDRVKELSAYEFGVTFGEMKKIQEDIHAKTEDVKMMGESIAQMIAENVAMENVLVGEEYLIQRIERRDEIEKLLKDIKVDEVRIKEIVKPIDNRITFELYLNIIHKNNYYRTVIKFPWVKELEANIMNGIDIDIKEFRNNLKDTDIINLSEIENELKEFEYFLTNRSLPLN